MQYPFYPTIPEVYPSRPCTPTVDRAEFFWFQEINFQHPLAWIPLSSHLPKWISVNICFVFFPPHNNLRWASFHVKNVSVRTLDLRLSSGWKYRMPWGQGRSAFQIVERQWLWVKTVTGLQNQSVLLFLFWEVRPQVDITVERESQYIYHSKEKLSNHMLQSPYYSSVETGSEMWKACPSPHNQLTFNLICACAPPVCYLASVMKPVLTGVPS